MRSRWHVPCRDLNDALNSIKHGAGAEAQLSQQLGKLKKDLCDSPSSAKDVDKMQDDLNDLKLRSGCGLPELECPVTVNSTMMCPHGGRVVCTPTDANRAMPN